MVTHRSVNKLIKVLHCDIFNQIQVSHEVHELRTEAHATVKWSWNVPQQMLTYIHTYVHTYIHTYTHTYIHTHIHTYTHTYIRIYIHICKSNHQETRTFSTAGTTVRSAVILAATQRVAVTGKWHWQLHTHHAPYCTNIPALHMASLRNTNLFLPWMHTLHVDTQQQHHVALY